MRVLVTGGTGLVGKALCERLVQQGWDVRVIGAEPETQLQNVEYARCDILDYAPLREQMRGCQVVIHLAAIPNPRRSPGQEVFQVNVAGTYNVFEAAASEGIRRIVQASSINAIGCAWSNTDIAPSYFPIDEQHPKDTNDPYSFSKEMIEYIGDFYWRRDGISSVAMRFPAVIPAARITSEPFRRGIEQMRTFLLDFARQPEAERAARIAEARRSGLEYRAKRLMELPHEQADVSIPPGDLLWRAWTFDRFNYWAFVDERDSAQAMEQALTAQFEGSHPLFINADRNTLGIETETLLKLFFPEVTQRTRSLADDEALVSIDKARALIGFEPEHTHIGGEA